MHDGASVHVHKRSEGSNHTVNLYRSRPRPASTIPAAGPARRVPAALSEGDGEADDALEPAVVVAAAALEALVIEVALGFDLVLVAMLVGMVEGCAATMMPPPAVEAAVTAVDGDQLDESEVGSELDPLRESRSDNKGELELEL